MVEVAQQPDQAVDVVRVVAAAQKALARPVDLHLAWLQGQYEAMGLEPGGPDGQWLQPVALKRYTPVAGATASWAPSSSLAESTTTGTDGQWVRT